jgi:hypothetical protein
MTLLDPVEYVAMIAIARRRGFRSCSTYLAAHESVVSFVRKDSTSSHKPIPCWTLEVGRWPSASGDSERCLVDVPEAGPQLARR